MPAPALKAEKSPGRLESTAGSPARHLQGARAAEQAGQL